MAAARTKHTTYPGARYQRLVLGSEKRKQSSPWNTPSSPRSDTCSPTTSTTTLPRSRRRLIHPPRPRPRHESHHPPSQRAGIHHPLRPHSSHLTHPTPTATASVKQVMTCCSLVVFRPAGGSPLLPGVLTPA
jgi:hypothetical protein